MPFTTDAEEIISELSAEALKAIESLKSAVDDLEKVFKRRKPGEAIPYGWVENINRPLGKVMGEVCRINGAVLVSVVEKPKV
jgi:hypothetical protein